MAKIERHSEAVPLIEQLLKIKGIRKKDLAELLGIDAPKLSQLFTRHIRFDDAVEMINAMGFDVIIKKTKAKQAMLSIEPDEPCDVCKYVKFANAMEEAISMLHANYQDEKTELDFTAEEEKAANYVEIK